MTAHNNGCGPIRYQAGDIIDHNRLPEHGSIQDIAAGTIGAFTHLFEVELFYARLIRCNGCTLNAHTVLLDGIGGIHSYLVVGRIAVFNAEIEIFNIYVQVGENQFVFNELPDDPGHFIAIQFHHRIGYFDLTHSGLILNASPQT